MVVIDVPTDHGEEDDAQAPRVRQRPNVLLAFGEREGGETWDHMKEERGDAVRLMIRLVFYHSRYHYTPKHGSNCFPFASHLHPICFTFAPQALPPQASHNPHTAI